MTENQGSMDKKAEATQMPLPQGASVDPFVTETGLGVQGGAPVGATALPETQPGQGVEGEFNLLTGGSFEDLVSTPLGLDDLTYEGIIGTPGEPDIKARTIERIRSLVADPSVSPEDFREQFKNLNASLIESGVQRSIRKGTASIDSLTKAVEEMRDVSFRSTATAVYEANASEEELDAADSNQIVDGRLSRNKQEFESLYFDQVFSLSKALETTDSEDAITVFGEKFTPNKVLKMLDDMGPTSVVATQSITSAYARVFPELSDPKRLGIPKLTVGSAARYVSDQIKNAATPEQAKNLTLRVIEELKKDAGTFASGNEYTVLRGLDLLKNRVIGDAGFGTDAIDNTFAFIEIAPVVGGLVRGARSAVNKAADRFLSSLGISPTIPFGTPADIATMTEKGTKKLLDAAVKNPQMLDDLGTSPAEVIGSLGLPKVGAGLDTGAKIDPSFISMSEIEKRVAKLAPISGRPSQSRMLQFNEQTGEVSYSFTYGTKDGDTFKTSKGAEQAKKKFGLNDAIVEALPEGGFVLKTFGKTDLTLSDVGAINPSTDIIRTGIAAMFGKAAVFGKDFANSSTRALLRTSRARGELKDMLSPFSSLGIKSQSKVANKLREGDMYIDEATGNIGKEYTKKELIDSGFSTKEIDGYFSARAVADSAFDVKNNALSKKLRDAGYVKLNVGESNAIAVKVSRLEVPANANTYFDVETQTYKKFLADSFNDASSFYRIKGDGFRSSFARVPKSTESTLISKLPDNVMKKLPGYLPRMYDNPYYVRQVFEEGGSAAVVAAKSRQEAEEIIAGLSKTNPGNKYEFAVASEGQGVLVELDDLEAAAAEGLLFVNKRRPDPIRDAAGNPTFKSPESSINAMIESTARTLGLNRWVDSAAQAYDKTYGDKFGKFVLGGSPEKKLGLGATTDEYAKALLLHKHINMVAGTTTVQLKRELDNTLSKLGEKTNGLFFGISKGLDAVGADSSASAVRNVGAAVEKALTGQSTAITNAIRSAVFTTYIGTNFARALFTQLLNFPQYLASPGGLAYVANPAGYVRDVGLLNMLMAKRVAGGLDSDAASKKMAKALGISNEKLYALTEGYKKSGVAQSYEDHILTAGTVFDGPISKANVLSRTAGRVTDLLQKGFEIGTLMDKRNSYLFALEEFKKVNKRYPKTDDEFLNVGVSAENLTLNQNRADKLPFSDGALGVITQFSSFPLKMSGRLLALESTFSKKQAAGMAALTVLSYGTQGIGAGELSDIVIDGISEIVGGSDKVTEDIKDAVRYASATALMNELFSAATDGKDVDLDLKSISPMSGGVFGITPDTLVKLYDGSSTLGETAVNMIEGALKPAALSLAMNSYKAAKFGYIVAGNTALDTDEKILAATSKAATVFPVLSNGFRGWLAYDMGMKVDTNGRPALEISKGEAMALLLLGVPTASEDDLRIAKDLMYSSREDLGSGKMMEVENHGKEFARSVIVPLMNDFIGEKRSLDEVIEIIDGFNGLVKYKSEYDQDKWRNAVFKEVEKAQVTSSDSFRDALFRSIRSGSQEFDNNLVREVKKAGYPPEQERAIIEYIEKQMR